MSDGMFGPGIFGTGIDLSALDENTALRLGQFYGEQIRDAEARGYQRAIDALREYAEHIAGYGEAYQHAADYLESLAPKEHGS